MNKLENIEIKILEHCNLKCKGCFVFSNIAQPEVYPLKELEKDLIQLNHLFDSIKNIRVLGGEPLLLNNLSDYILLIRKQFLSAQISIVTNGTLLDILPDSFYELLNKNQIMLSISYYKGSTMKKVRHGIQRVMQNQINFQVFPVKYFAIEHVREQTEPLEKVYYACKLRKKPVTLYRGRIYSCPKPFSIRHYDKLYGTSYEDINLGIDIYDARNGEKEILRRLAQPMEICKICSSSPGYMEWQIGQPQPQDWFKEKNNRLMLENVEWYENLAYNLSLRYNLLECNLDTKCVKLRDCKEKELKKTLDSKVYVWLHDENAIEIYHKLLSKTLQNEEIMLSGVINNGIFVNDLFCEHEIVTWNELSGLFSIILLASDYHELMNSVKRIVRLVKNNSMNMD